MAQTIFSHSPVIPLVLLVEIICCGSPYSHCSSQGAYVSLFLLFVIVKVSHWVGGNGDGSQNKRSQTR